MTPLLLELTAEPRLAPRLTASRRPARPRRAQVPCPRLPRPMTTKRKPVCCTRFLVSLVARSRTRTLQRRKPRIRNADNPQSGLGGEVMKRLILPAIIFSAALFSPALYAQQNNSAF